MKKNFTKVNLKKLIINITLPLLLGTIVGFLSGSSNGYQEFIKPSFAPPGIVFPIVWTILYILMGISAYIITNSNSNNKKNAIKTYYISLVINLLWSFLFFKFKLILLSAIWILLLIYFVILMIIKYFAIKKVAGLLQLPYLLWLIFAFILNISIYLIN